MLCMRRCARDVGAVCVVSHLLKDAVRALLSLCRIVVQALTDMFGAACLNVYLYVPCALIYLLLRACEYICVLLRAL